MTPGEAAMICGVVSFWALVACGFILFIADKLVDRLIRIEAAIIYRQGSEDPVNPRLRVERTSCRRHIPVEVRR